MKLRKHQQEMSDICDEILNGEPITEIICDVTPGGGKTALGIILAKKLVGSYADKLSVFVPRNSLKYQFENDMLDPFFESGKEIRVADNTPNPSRGLDGFSTTYQGLGANPKHFIDDYNLHKYIGFHDEFHHIGEKGSWSIPLQKLRDSAFLNVYATGTAFRQMDRISFLPYGEDGLLDRQPTKNRRFITYSRSDALREGAICPIEFDTIDGTGAYIKKGKLREYKTLEHVDLQVALVSDYAYQLLDHGIEKFLAYQQYCPDAKCVIVAKDIETAKDYAAYIKNRIDCRVVTSDDKNSLDTIDKFRKGEFSVMSSVAMCYEGLSIKDISDIICLTHIRSISWLGQMVARGVRIRSWKECCRVTAPADPKFMEFITALLEEQEQVCGTSERKSKKKKGRGQEEREEVEILSSEAIITASSKEKIARDQLNYLINSYIGKEAIKTGSYVHTESMRRRKILWMKIYLAIGRKCKLKEMTYEEMNKSLELIKTLTN